MSVGNFGWFVQDPDTRRDRDDHGDGTHNVDEIGIIRNVRMVGRKQTGRGYFNLAQFVSNDSRNGRGGSRARVVLFPNPRYCPSILRQLPFSRIVCDSTSNL